MRSLFAAVAVLAAACKADSPGDSVFIQTLVETEDGMLVALGYASDNYGVHITPISATSTDGEQWKVRDNSPWHLEYRQYEPALRRRDGLLYGVARTAQSGEIRIDSPPSYLIVSTDGATWTSAFSTSGGRVQLPVPRGDGWALLFEETPESGYQLSMADADMSEWTTTMRRWEGDQSKIPMVAASPDTLAVLAPNDFWRSADGVAWFETAVSTHIGLYVTQFGWSREGFVARTQEGRLYSADGWRWHLSDAPTPELDPPAQILDGAVYGADGSGALKRDGKRVLVDEETWVEGVLASETHGRVFAHGSGVYASSDGSEWESVLDFEDVADVFR